MPTNGMTMQELWKQGSSEQSGPTATGSTGQQAVEAFHAGVIGFLDILDTVERVVEAHQPESELSLETVLEAERWARAEADRLLSASAG